MKKYSWSLGLLTAGIILILADIGIQYGKPEFKKFAIGMGITGTLLIIIATGMLFSIKPIIVIG